MGYDGIHPPKASADIGVVGMGTMGQNLALNIASRGFTVAAYNRPDEFAARLWQALERATAAAAAAARPISIQPFTELAPFCAALARPRHVLLSIPSGAPVDACLAALLPCLEAGDVVLDGGNEQFRETERRVRQLMDTKGVHLVGMGISGGAEGARNGPSLMPGCSPEAYAVVEPILAAMAARAPNGDACVARVGLGGSGHYVKMVHNGIEYADMQLLAEAYHVLRMLGGMGNEEMSGVMKQYNAGPLQSYLVEITARVLVKKDDQAAKGEASSGFLLDMILDESGSKGTGSWTVQSAAELGVPVPTISAALDARYLSRSKAERSTCAKLYGPVHESAHKFDGGPAKKSRVGPAPPIAGEDLVKALEAALYLGKVCAYAQGLALIGTASAEFGWSLHMAAVVGLWRGGCIIRAALLEDIIAAFKDAPNLTNLLLSEKIAAKVKPMVAQARRLVATCMEHQLPVPALSSAVAYLDALCSTRLPANMIQAQRDVFGAHTFKRIDREGSFHCEW